MNIYPPSPPQPPPDVTPITRIAPMPSIPGLTYFPNQPPQKTSPSNSANNSANGANLQGGSPDESLNSPKRDIATKKRKREKISRSETTVDASDSDSDSENDSPPPKKKKQKNVDKDEKICDTITDVLAKSRGLNESRMIQRTIQALEISEGLIVSPLEVRNAIETLTRRETIELESGIYKQKNVEYKRFFEQQEKALQPLYENEKVHTEDQELPFEEWAIKEVYYQYIVKNPGCTSGDLNEHLDDLYDQGKYYDVPEGSRHPPINTLLEEKMIEADRSYTPYKLYAMGVLKKKKRKKKKKKKKKRGRKKKKKRKKSIKKRTRKLRSPEWVRGFRELVLRVFFEKREGGKFLKRRPYIENKVREKVQLDEHAKYRGFTEYNLKMAVSYLSKNGYIVHNGGTATRAYKFSKSLSDEQKEYDFDGDSSDESDEYDDDSDESFVADDEDESSDSDSDEYLVDELLEKSKMLSKTLEKEPEENVETEDEDEFLDFADNYKERGEEEFQPPPGNCSSSDEDDDEDTPVKELEKIFPEIQEIQMDKRVTHASKTTSERPTVLLRALGIPKASSGRALSGIVGDGSFVPTGISNLNIQRERSKTTKTVPTAPTPLRRRKHLPSKQQGAKVVPQNQTNRPPPNLVRRETIQIPGNLGSGNNVSKPAGSFMQDVPSIADIRRSDQNKKPPPLTRAVELSPKTPQRLSKLTKAGPLLFQDARYDGHSYKFLVGMIVNYRPGKFLVGSEVCNLYLANRCKWGKSCKHVHVERNYFASVVKKPVGDLVKIGAVQRAPPVRRQHTVPPINTMRRQTNVNLPTQGQRPRNIPQVRQVRQVLPVNKNQQRVTPPVSRPQKPANANPTNMRPRNKSNWNRMTTGQPQNAQGVLGVPGQNGLSVSGSRVPQQPRQRKQIPQVVSIAQLIEQNQTGKGLSDTQKLRKQRQQQQQQQQQQQLVRQRRVNRPQMFGSKKFVRRSQTSTNLGVTGKFKPLWKRDSKNINPKSPDFGKGFTIFSGSDMQAESMSGEKTEVMLINVDNKEDVIMRYFSAKHENVITPKSMKNTPESCWVMIDGFDGYGEEYIKRILWEKINNKERRYFMVLEILSSIVFAVEYAMRLELKEELWKYLSFDQIFMNFTEEEQAFKEVKLLLFVKTEKSEERKIQKFIMKLLKTLKSVFFDADKQVQYNMLVKCIENNLNDEEGEKVVCHLFKTLENIYGVQKEKT